MQVGQQIRKIVEARGVTQREVAIGAGIAEAHFSSIICGRHTPRVRTLENIAEAIGHEVKLVPKQQEGDVT